MKKMKKRAIAILLALCITAAALPISVSATDYTPYVSEGLNFTTSDGITYYDIYNEDAYRPDTSDSKIFFEDVLSNAYIPYDKDTLSPASLWDSLAASLTSESGVVAKGNLADHKLSEWYNSLLNKDTIYQNTNNNLFYYPNNNTTDKSIAPIYSNYSNFVLANAIHNTGIQYAGSLKDAAEKIRSGVNGQLKNYTRHKGHNDDEFALLPLTDTKSQDVYYTINTVFAQHGDNEAHKSVQGLTYGTIFYDFEIAYLETGQAFNTALTKTGYKSLEEAADNGIPGVSYNIPTSGSTVLQAAAINETPSEINKSITYGELTTESVSNTRVHTEEYTLGESLNLGLSYNKKTGLTTAGVGSEWTFSVNLGFEATQMWSDTWEDSESYEDSIDKLVTDSFTIFPHTQQMVQVYKDTAAFTLGYDFPVAVTYKTIPYATYFIHNTKGDINNEIAVVLGNFGRDKETGNHAYAVGNLQMRYQNRDRANYDIQYGDGINWNDTLKGTFCTSEGDFYYNLENRIKTLISYRPFSVTGGSLSYNGDSTITKILDASPLYPLKEVTTSEAYEYTLSEGDKLFVDNIKLLAYNNKGVEYYGFQQKLGSWKLLNEDGTEHTDGSIAILKKNVLTGFTTLEAKGPGTVYLKYYIPENKYTYGKGTTFSTSNDVETVAIPVTIAGAAEFNGYVVAEVSGADSKVTTHVGESINLDALSTLNVAVYDSDDFELNRPVIWKARQSSGIQVIDNNLITSEEGIFQIAATCGDKRSDWITVESLPKRSSDVMSVQGTVPPSPGFEVSGLDNAVAGLNEENSSLQLRVNENIPVGNELQKEIESITDKPLIACFDLTLAKLTVYEEGGEPYYSGNISETDELIKVQIPIPERTNPSTVQLLRKHGDKAMEIIPVGAANANTYGEYMELQDGFIYAWLRCFSFYATAGEVLPPEKLISFEPAPDLVNIPNGTPIEELPLPKTTSIITDGSSSEAEIIWDMDSITGYDSSKESEQTFSVSGSLLLPGGVKNPDLIPLDLSINVTVKAKNAGVHTITFDPNGGTCETKTLQTEASGKLKSLPAALREQYSFDGWYLAREGGSPITIANIFTQNTTLYAHWTYIGENHIHHYGDEWKLDAQEHWHECSCGDKSDISAHTFQWVIDKKATSTQAGIKHQECTICGYKKEPVAIPIENNSPDTGDSQNTILTLSVLLSSGVLCILLYTKRRQVSK